MTTTWQLESTPADGVKLFALSSSTGRVCGGDSDCILESELDFGAKAPQLVQVTYFGGHCPLYDTCYDADKWALEYLQAHSLRLFQRQLDPAEVKAIYRPLIDRSEPKLPSVLAGIDMRTLAFYEFFSGKTGRPFGLGRESVVTIAFEIRHMWIAATEDACGLKIDIVEIAYDGDDV